MTVVVFAVIIGAWRLQHDYRRLEVRLQANNEQLESLKKSVDQLHWVATRRADRHLAELDASLLDSKSGVKQKLAQETLTQQALSDLTIESIDDDNLGAEAVVSDFEKAMNRLTQYGFSAFEAQRIATLEQVNREKMRELMKQSKPEYVLQANQLLGEFITTLRSELGDYGFENYLRSSGLDTAVRIRSVEKKTAAEQAGLRRGDSITHYDGKRVFDIQELIQVTQSGNLSGYVQLKVLRGSKELTVELPRGTMGISSIPFQPHQFFRMGAFQ